MSFSWVRADGMSRRGTILVFSLWKYREAKGYELYCTRDLAFSYSALSLDKPRDSQSSVWLNTSERLPDEKYPNQTIGWTDRVLTHQTHGYVEG